MTDYLQARLDDLLDLVRSVATRLAQDADLSLETEAIERICDEIGRTLRSFAEAGTEPPSWLPAFNALFDAWHHNTLNRLIGRGAVIRTPGHA